MQAQAGGTALSSEAARGDAIQAQDRANALSAPIASPRVPLLRFTKPRLLVTTDLGGDPDDQQSMRRLMLYANEFEIVGLIASALAQALFDVRAARNATDTAAFVAKLRVYAIADQDKTPGQQGTGEWIHRSFPDLRYVEAGPPAISGFTAVFRGMYQNDSAGGGHPTLDLVESAVARLNQSAWVTANVRSGHGPLGANYPLVGQNPGTARNTRGVKEGDTPSWFFVLPNGLGDPAQPSWGGWGGRFVPDRGGHFIDAEDDHWSGTSDAATRRKWTVARWRATV